MRSTTPPPFVNYTPVSGDDLWQKIRTGEIEAHVYSGEARGDLEPVPIQASEFFIADEARMTGDEYGPPPDLAPFQILWRDSDPRRSRATRRAVRVPHWVYVKKAEPHAECATNGNAPPRSSPEQIRARAVLKAIFGEATPSREELTDTELLQRVNDHQEKKNVRPIGKDTLLRTAGRRK